MTSQKVFFLAKATLTLAAVAALCHVVNKRYREYRRRAWLQQRDNGYVTDDHIETFWRERGVSVQPAGYIRARKGGVAIDDVQAYRSDLLVNRKFKDTEVKPRVTALDASTVLVVMHIQKTGGTYLENALVLHTNRPCSCRPMPGAPDRLMCSCVNERGQDWQFSRHTVGWPCGVHPGYMELKACVDTYYAAQEGEDRTRKYRYITVLRDPVARFVSEWSHVRRGATWKECRLQCDGRDATEEEVPFCFRHGTWADVSFDDFINCESNMAFNRQTRMLANLSPSGCYRRQHRNLTSEQRGEIMLHSARANLAKQFSYFGLLEMARASQALLEHTFPGLRLTKDLDVSLGARRTNFLSLSEAHYERVIQRNLLDVRLYQFARSLFLQRLQHAGIALGAGDHAPRAVEANFTYEHVAA